MTYQLKPILVSAPAGAALPPVPPAREDSSVVSSRRGLVARNSSSQSDRDARLFGQLKRGAGARQARKLFCFSGGGRKDILVTSLGSGTQVDRFGLPKFKPQANEEEYDGWFGFEDVSGVGLPELEVCAAAGVSWSSWVGSDTGEAFSVHPPPCSEIESTISPQESPLLPAGAHDGASSDGAKASSDVSSRVSPSPPFAPEPKLLWLEGPICSVRIMPQAGGDAMLCVGSGAGFAAVYTNIVMHVRP